MVSNAPLNTAVTNDESPARTEEEAEDTATIAIVRTPEEIRQCLRMVEAMLFASAEPIAADAIAERLPAWADENALLRELQEFYSSRGVHIVQVAGKWAMRTAPDLSFLLSREASEQRKLSRAALETLAIIAYHQPVTRAEIEEIRGVATSSGTIDVLLETGWIRMRGRRKVPGRPITYGTTEAFLSHFGLDSVGDLPGVEELKAAGLLDSRVPPDFSVPEPSDAEALREDEDPLDEEDQADVVVVDQPASSSEGDGSDTGEVTELASGDGTESERQPSYEDSADAPLSSDVQSTEVVPTSEVPEERAPASPAEKKAANTFAAVARAIAVELEASASQGQPKLGGEASDEELSKSLDSGAGEPTEKGQSGAHEEVIALSGNNVADIDEDPGRKP